jgi:hypothetical protein
MIDQVGGDQSNTARVMIFLFLPLLLIKNPILKRRKIKGNYLLYSC